MMHRRVNILPPRVGGSSHLSHALAMQYRDCSHEVVVLPAALHGRAVVLRVPHDSYVSSASAWDAGRLSSAIRHDVRNAGPDSTRTIRTIFASTAPRSSTSMASSST